MLTTLVANSPTSRLHSDNNDLKMAREIMNELVVEFELIVRIGRDDRISCKAI